MSNSSPTFHLYHTDMFPQLGTFGRAKAKVEEMTNVIARSRTAGH